MKCKAIVTSWSLNEALNNRLKDIHYVLIGFKWFFIPHGVTAGDKNSYEISMYNWGNPDVLFTGSDIERSVFTNSLGYRNVVTTGYPRYDKWKICSGNSNNLAIFFSWRRLLNDHVNFIHSNYFRFINQLISEISYHFPNLKVFYFFHPAISLQNQKSIEHSLNSITNDIIYVRNNDDSQNFIDAVNQCDTLITDYSSISFDFGYKHSRVIYFLPKAFCDGGYSIQPNFYNVLMGKVATSVDECIKLLSSNQRCLNTSFFTFVDNNNCKRVYDYLSNYK